MRDAIPVDRDQPAGIRLPARLLSGLAKGLVGAWRAMPRWATKTWWLAAILGLAAVAIGAYATLAVFGGAKEGSPDASTAGITEVTNAENTDLSARDLVPVLTRYGVGPGDTGIDITYAPRAFFEIAGIAPPAEMDSQPTLAFFMQENIHEGDLPGELPQVFLQREDGERVPPYNARVTAEDPHHRTTRLLFPQPGGWSPEGEGTLTIVVPLDDGRISAGNTFTWDLPLDLPTPPGARELDRAGQAAEVASVPADLGLSTMTKSLRKGAKGVRSGYTG